jgi:hypothetical protein
MWAYFLNGWRPVGIPPHPCVPNMWDATTMTDVVFVKGYAFVKVTLYGYQPTHHMNTPKTKAKIGLMGYWLARQNMLYRERLRCCVGVARAISSRKLGR